MYLKKNPTIMFYVSQILRYMEDTVAHLFLECPFVKSCWNLFNIVFNINSSFPEKLFLRSDHKLIVCWAI